MKKEKCLECGKDIKMYGDEAYLITWDGCNDGCYHIDCLPYQNAIASDNRWELGFVTEKEADKWRKAAGRRGKYDRKKKH